jgi:hypothetical protein
LASREVWSVFGWYAMRRPDFFHRRGRVAGSLLGRGQRGRARRAGVGGESSLAGLRSDHPLVHRTDALYCTGRQCSHVAAVLTGSVIARAEGGRWATGLVVSAACVLAGLSVMLALRVQARRDCVTDLIINGQEDLPIRIVQRARDRLISARNCLGLARSLENLADQAVTYRARRVRLGPPLFQPLVVAEVVNELRELSGLLRTGPVSARGVARLERLVGHATSLLYGGDAGALRDELCGVCVQREGSELNDGGSRSGTDAES